MNTVRAPKALPQLILKKLYMHPEGVPGNELWTHVSTFYPAFTYVDFALALDTIREAHIAHCTNRRWWIRDAGAHASNCHCKVCLEMRSKQT